jgi:hypothetical protein
MEVVGHHDRRVDRRVEVLRDGGEHLGDQHAECVEAHRPVLDAPENVASP